VGKREWRGASERDIRNQGNDFVLAAVGAQRKLDQAVGDAEKTVERFSPPAHGSATAHMLDAGMAREFRQMRPRDMPEHRHVGDDPFK